MKIGIDISQVVYGTGVGAFIEHAISEMIAKDQGNEYILFGSSFRQMEKLQQFVNRFAGNKNVTVKLFSLPPSLLDMLWNTLHILPIERFIGKVDIFLSSDWTQPPSRAKKATILYDLIVCKYPEETAKIIVNTQKKRLKWVKKECDKILCISQATKQDAVEILHIEEERLGVITPGII